MSMNELDNKILEFAEQINRYGYAITMCSQKNGMKSSIQSTFIPIQELTNGVPFYVFLKEVIDNLSLDKLIVVAKQKNGLNAYKNPKIFTLDMPVTPTHQKQNIANNPQQVGVGLTGYPTPVSSDPMNQVLSFKIEQQNQQIQELKPFKEKYENEREKRFDLERSLKLIEEKHDLEKAKEDYNSKNSFAGVISEMKEPIAAALAGLAGNIQTTEPEALGSVSPSNSKVNFLLQLFNEMDPETIESIFEINTRLAFVRKAISPVLKVIKENTKEIDSDFEEIKNQH